MKFQSQRSIFTKLRWYRSLFSRRSVDSFTTRELTAIRKAITRLVKLLRYGFSNSQIRKQLGAAAIAVVLAMPAAVRAQTFQPAQPLANQAAVEGPVLGTLSDIDDDGDLDYVGFGYSDLSDGQAFAFIENSGGPQGLQFEAATYIPSEQLEALLNISFVSGSADIDGDGELEIFTTAYDGNTYQPTIVYIELMADGSLEPNSILLPEISGLVDGFVVKGQVVDFDNDGDLDVLLTPYEESSDLSANLIVVENLGGAVDEANFAEPVLNPNGFNPLTSGMTSLDLNFFLHEIADFDNDGNLEVFTVASDYLNSEFHYYDNDGNGFIDPVAITTIEALKGIAIPSSGDIDNDGDLDILVNAYDEYGDYYATSISIIENTILSSVIEVEEVHGAFDLMPKFDDEMLLSYHLDENYDQLTVTVMDVMGKGQEMSKNSHPGSQGQINLDISAFVDGVIYVRIIADNNITTLEAVKVSK